MSTCVVCNITTTKYKCPYCFERYCSVACCKAHKESCLREKQESTAEGASVVLQEKENDLIARERDLLIQDKGDDDADSDKVPDELLLQLEHSSELKDLLNNPHLRAMMENLVNTDKPEEAVANAMHEPIFTEFADVCLQIVDRDNPNLEHVGKVW